MKIVWDKAKNRANVKKHGIDFRDAEDVFASPMLTEIDDRLNYDEERIKGLGTVNGLIVVVIFTETVTQEDQIIRIISMRKALKHERKNYEKEIINRLG